MWAAASRSTHRVPILDRRSTTVVSWTSSLASTTEGKVRRRPPRVRFNGTSAVRVLLVALTAACARPVAPLRGTPSPPSSLPRLDLVGARQVTFRWDYSEDIIFARGEGVARMVAPDSARLDFFVDGGFGSGHALLFGDRIVTPGGDLVEGMLPSAPMLWAAIGRLAIPGARDTVVTVDGGVLRADI